MSKTTSESISFSWIIEITTEGIFKKINENVDDHEKEGDRGEWFLSEKKRRAALIPDDTSSLLDQPSHHTIDKYMQYCMWNSEIKSTIK